MEYKAFLPAAWTEFTNKCKALFPFLKRTFQGTRAEWDALSSTEQANYDIVNLTDDVADGGAVVVDEVTSGNLNAVTSNAVYDGLVSKLSFYQGDGSSLSDAFDAAGISKVTNDIYGVCTHIVNSLIKGSGVADNTVTLHNYTAGGPAFAIILQKQSTAYGAALLFYYGSTVVYELRYTNGDYHIKRFG